MQWIAMVLVVGLLASITLGVASPSWVDPSKVVGTLIFAHEFRLNSGYIACWGTATDPDGDALEITLVNPPDGAALTVDPNGSWIWKWTPPAMGTYYVTLMAKEAIVPPDEQGHGLILNTLVTTAVRVGPENQPPVVTPGGCRVFGH